MKLIDGFIDEEQLAIDLINDKKLINDNPRRRIIAYIKYLKNYPDPDTGEMLYKKQIREKIDNLMYKYYDGFSMANWDDNIKKDLNKYTKNGEYKFNKPKLIGITANELNTIASLNDINKEKVLFILLVFSKVNRNSGRTDDYWVFKDGTLLFSLAKYKYNRIENRNTQRNYLINDFDNLGLVSQSVKINSEGIRVDFAEEGESEIIFTPSMNNIKSMYCYYLKWKNYPVKECENCGNLFEYNPKTKKPTLYCKECKKKVNIKQTIERNKNKNTFIYSIKNKINNKIYIGQTRCGRERWSNHKYELNNNCHSNKHLQNAWNKYGEDNFEFSILEYCIIDNLNDSEIRWIEYYDSTNPDKGYNLESGGRVNKKISEETKQKLRDINPNKIPVYVYDNENGELIEICPSISSTRGYHIQHKTVSDFCKYKMGIHDGLVYSFIPLTKEEVINYPEFITIEQFNKKCERNCYIKFGMYIKDIRIKLEELSNNKNLTKEENNKLLEIKDFLCDYDKKLKRLQNVFEI